MKESDFSAGKTGRLVSIPEGVRAFVPAALPPTDLSPTWELAELNSRADRSLSELAGLSRILTNAHLLSGSFRRREAILSSRIEGTQTTMSELLLFEASGDTEGESGEVKEVWNYVRALDHGLTRLGELPVSNRLIREIHGKLMEGVRGADKTPGEFRTLQNYIGPTRITRIEDATYVPPPPKEMITCMNELEVFIHEESKLPPLIRQALIHYQFEAIHPFQDGNGRVGRLLLTLNLCAEGIVPHPLLYVSEYMEKHKDEYYDLLYTVSSKGNWESWIKFFLNAVIQQSKDAQERAHTLHSLMSEHRARLVAMGAPASTFQILDMLFYMPAISSTTVTKTIGGNINTAQRIIARLQKAKIISEVPTGRKRNKLYMADEIYNAVSG